MICYQNWHKEEDRSNCNELTMLPKAAISVCGIFVKPEKQETPICKHSVLEETPKFKHSALGLKFRFFSGGLPTCPGGRASAPPAILLVTCLHPSLRITLSQKTAGQQSTEKKSRATHSGENKFHWKLETVKITYC